MTIQKHFIESKMHMNVLNATNRNLVDCIHILTHPWTTISIYRIHRIFMLRQGIRVIYFVGEKQDQLCKKYANLQVCKEYATLQSMQRVCNFIEYATLF